VGEFVGHLLADLDPSLASKNRGEFLGKFCDIMLLTSRVTLAKTTVAKFEK
jgi:hypothetical protein